MDNWTDAGYIVLFVLSGWGLYRSIRFMLNPNRKGGW